MIHELNRPICIFDSGIGGITVYNQLKKLLPHEEIIYLGDTARIPYGTKSKEIIKKFCVEIVEYLKKFHPKVIIIACNTASALAGKYLEKRYPYLKFFNVIEPAVNEALKYSSKKIAIIGTYSTIKSKIYPLLIKSSDPTRIIYQKACPLFVPAIEEGKNIGDKIIKLLIEEYLKKIKRENITTVILGCTHYPLIKQGIQEYLGESFVLIDSALPVAKKVKEYLFSKKLISSSINSVQDKILVTDRSSYYTKIIRNFLEFHVPCVKKISL